MSEQILSNKKQFVYGSFNARLIASMVDVLIMSVPLIPLMKISEYLILKGKTPEMVTTPVLKEAMEKYPASGMDVLNYLINDPRIYEYFITEGALNKIILNNGVQALLFVVVIALLGFWLQSSPGKMMFSMKIVDEKTLDKPSKKQCIIRSLGYIVSSIPLGLGFLWMAFDKKHQTWHDKLAGTIVIKK